MSPITNLRRDEYGGRPENRIRLAVDLVTAIKRRVGSTYPVLCRIGARDFIQGGLEIDESIVMARSLLEAGVDVIDVAGGLGGIEPPENRGQGYLIPEAEAIKRATGATVIGVGGITDCRFADKVIREGKVDLVAVGRAMLRDPRWCLNALRTISQGET
jgi:NADPH2 dehydrogenase